MGNREMEPREFRIPYTVDRPPYNDHFETVKIPEEDIEIGAEIYDLFYDKLIRQLAWNIRGGVVTVPSTRERIYGLENEQISEELARAINGFKMVEGLLPDYMQRGSELERIGTQ